MLSDGLVVLAGDREDEGFAVSSWGSVPGGLFGGLDAEISPRGGSIAVVRLCFRLFSTVFDCFRLFFV